MISLLISLIKLLTQHKKGGDREGATLGNRNDVRKKDADIH
jgi:hypothetical protein